MKSAASAPERQFNDQASRFLNVAATCQSTYSLGPGKRAVVWVQGCPFRCPGCISPEWISDTPARIVSPKDLVTELLADPQVTGLTFSGGEPMLQAAGLAEVIRLARRQRELSLICFTGFTLDVLRNNPPSRGVASLLAEVDVLVDGPYVAGLNENRGLRGSSNQRIHYLTPRLSTYFLEETPRKAEIQIYEGQAFLVGVPPRGMSAAFSTAIHQMEHAQYRMVQHERA